MNILRYSDPDFAGKLSRLQAASSLFDPVIEERTKAIIDAVRLQGDAALCELTQKFDGATVTPEGLGVTTAERVNATLGATDDLRKAVDAAHKNIRFFSKKSMRKNWSAKNPHGAFVGEKFDPFQRVGIYIPGGTAPLVSSALMTVTLAEVAGCPEIVVCTPPNKEGRINDALLHALNTAGATEIYRLGGAQAISAMALGTETIQPVQKIYGPGNAYVVAAKRLLFGRVGIDLLPGPSEVMVLADDSSNPAFIAADLLAQAEHGSGHERVWLVTPSAKLIKAVQKEIDKQLPKLTRADFIRKALDNNGWLIQVTDLGQGVSLANRLAPEHCEVMTQKAAKVAELITTAGAIFLGSISPTVLGDYVAGPSHTLPTGGGGLSFAGLTVDQFQRRTSLVEYNAAALKKALPLVAQFAAMEGLDAHGQSAAIRARKSGK